LAAPDPFEAAGEPADPRQLKAQNLSRFGTTEQAICSPISQRRVDFAVPRGPDADANFFS